MPKWLVHLKAAPEIELEVDAVDRWGAVVAFAEETGIADKARMQQLFDDSSVKKAAPRKVRKWRSE